MSVIGAVLTGGRSSRMGSDKSRVDVGGTSMLERVAGALEDVVSRVVILGDEHEGFESWPDQVDVAGPLAGIATALSRTETARVLLVAVDHPFVRIDTLSHLVSIDTDLALVPVDDEGVRQVTCAVYPKSIAPLAVEEAEAGGSIQSLLDRVSFEPVAPSAWRAWGEDGRSWFSVDTPEALEVGLRQYL